jgi:hypothetical protein
MALIVVVVGQLELLEAVARKEGALVRTTHGSIIGTAVELVTMELHRAEGRDHAMRGGGGPAA